MGPRLRELLDILSQRDMEKGDRQRTYALTNSVAMHTADGEVSADKGIVMNPFGDEFAVERYILPNSPSLLSVGRLCLEADFCFSWPGAKSPG